MKFELFDNIEFGGIDYVDYTDHSDIYVVSADYAGQPLDGDQLDQLNRDSQLIFELYVKYGD